VKITDILFLNLKRLKTQTRKALYLILPVAVLIGLSVIISSQVDNVRNALQKSVFKTISQQYTLLEVKIEQEEFDPSSFMRGGTSSFEQNRFSDIDVETINGIDGVKDSSLQVQVPVSNVSVLDLFEDKDFKISSLMGISSKAVTLYVDDDFEYVEGEPIPIILNANDFIYSYQNWNGENEIILEMPTPGEGGDPQSRTERMSFIKTEAIEYTKEDTLGKEITISFGGLDEIQSYQMERTDDGMKIVKLEDEELKEKEDERKEAISQYWSYDKISQPLKYTFKVVGVFEDESSRVSYVPEDFTNQLMSDYITNEIEARTAEIPSDVLNSDFLGLTYDGEEVSSSGRGMFSQIGRRFGGFEGGGMKEGGAPTLSGYTIPGLIIKLNDNDEVVGAVTDANVYSESQKYGDTISVVINKVEDRAEVISFLNKAGYAYQDLGDLDVFERIEKTLDTLSTGFLISFVVLIGAIVALTMSKFISESVKDIGIFRALGMKRNLVLLMYMLQSLLYVLIGYIIGGFLGVIGNLLTSSFVSSWFNNFIENTISKSFDVVETIDMGIFMNINWESILLYTVLLFVITLVISVFPSLSASRISPVEAIKSE